MSEQETQKISTIKKYLSVKEAAEYIGRSEDAVRILKKRGKLKASQGDGRVFFEVLELERFMSKVS